jgi:hypothetical protein
VDELIAVAGLGLGASLGLGLVRGVARVLRWFRAEPTAGGGMRRAGGAYTYSSGGQTWYLHARSPAAPGRRKLRVFYFARQPRPDESVAELPAGFEVTTNPRTGMPLLRRRREPRATTGRTARH